MSHFAKTKVDFIGLIILNRLKCKYVILNGDSLNVINMLRDVLPPIWDIKSMIIEARRIIEAIKNIIIQHKFYEANLLACRIMDEVVGMVDLRVQENDLSEHFVALAIEYGWESQGLDWGGMELLVFEFEVQARLILQKAFNSSISETF